MLTKGDVVPGATAMISKRGQKQHQQLSLHQLSNGKPSTSAKSKSKSEDGRCTHCGNMKHTKDTCFKLTGYPKWWHKIKAKSKHEAGGDALVNTRDFLIATTNINSQLIQQTDSSFRAVNISMDFNDSGNLDWIIDSGATDMTFDSRDFIESSQPKRTCIANANGVTYPVIGAGKVALSPSFSLPNTLLVPSLSAKLLSVGQATEEMNCCALIYPKFCLFQDILTKEIIGRGTKRDGIYYMDDISLG